MSVNAFAALLEAFFNIFFADTHTHTRTHTDTKALLYPCCACAWDNDVCFVVSSLTTSPTTSITTSLRTGPFTGGGNRTRIHVTLRFLRLLVYIYICASALITCVIITSRTLLPCDLA